MMFFQRFAFLFFVLLVADVFNVEDALKTCSINYLYCIYFPLPIMKLLLIGIYIFMYILY